MEKRQYWYRSTSVILYWLLVLLTFGGIWSTVKLKTLGMCEILPKLDVLVTCHIKPKITVKFWKVKIFGKK